MARIYSDENFPLPAVQELRRLGHDVLTTAESGSAGRKIPDLEVLAFAIREQRLLILLNRKHFINLHQKDSNHFGIIVCTFDPDFVALAKRIDNAIQATLETKGSLIRVNRPNP